MDDEVTKFEESILFFADAYRLHGPGSEFGDPSGQKHIDPTPSLTRGSSTPSSFSISSSDSKRFPLDSGEIQTHYGETIQDFLRESDIHGIAKNKELEEWQFEAAGVDRAIQILPGVKRLIESIPAGRYAVATSGTKTYGDFTYLIFS